MSFLPPLRPPPNPTHLLAQLLVVLRGTGLKDGRERRGLSAAPSIRKDSWAPGRDLAPTGAVGGTASETPRVDTLKKDERWAAARWRRGPFPSTGVSLGLLMPGLVRWK